MDAKSHAIAASLARDEINRIISRQTRWIYIQRRFR